MNIRVVVLAVVTCLFAAAWSSDRTYQAVTAGSMSRPNQPASHYETLTPVSMNRPAAAIQLLSASSFAEPLPVGMGPGVWQVVSHAGMIQTLIVAEHDLQLQPWSRDGFFTSQTRDGQNSLYFIRLDEETDLARRIADNPVDSVLR